MDRRNAESSWIDYTINNNPNGVMRVLSKYGYMGYLAPQNEDEMRYYAYEIIHKFGDDGVMDFLRAHPEYGAFEEYFSYYNQGNPQTPYMNAINQQSIQQYIDNNRQLLKNLAIIAFVLLFVKLGEPTK